MRSYNLQEVTEETQPQVIDQVPAGEEVFQVVREGMIAASQPGGTSAASWIDFPYTVASKTTIVPGVPRSLPGSPAGKLALCLRDFNASVVPQSEVGGILVLQVDAQA